MLGRLKDNIEKVMRNPKRLFRGLNRLWHRRFFTRSYNTPGIDIFEEDWDNLIILDACRCDLFEEKVDTSKFDGYERKISRGSNSFEFVKSNFFDKDLKDTVYLTANGHIFWMEDEIGEVKLHDKIMLEGEEEGVPFPPSSMKDQVVEKIESYPDKRLVMHLMQPHYPFIDYPKVPNEVSQFWDKVFDGEIDATDEELWEGYSQNFDLVWPEVMGLVDELEGKTVITSDHGNMFGERATPLPIREHGHPLGIYTRQLVEVPWLVIEEGERREIVKGEASEETDYNEEKIKDQLADLGYEG